LDWLAETAFPVWVDEVCGDGTCNEPFEFPAYGRFGCRADCGSNTNLTTMLLQVRADFRDDLYSPRALMSAAAWNLCKRDEAAKKAGFPRTCAGKEDVKRLKEEEGGMLHFDALILGGCKFYCLRKEGCEDITKCKGYKKSKGEELSFEDFETMARGGEKTQKQVQFLPKNEPPICG
jgi:hypothetical protein